MVVYNGNMADDTYTDPDSFDYEAYIRSTADPIWLSDSFESKCRYALEHAGFKLTHFEVNPDASMVTFAGQAPFASVEDGVRVIDQQFWIAGCEGDGVLAFEGGGNWSGA